MRTYSLIIQGEGKGHYSQARALIDQFCENGSTVNRIYLGRNFFRSTPEYFTSHSGIPLRKFYSPNFIRSTNLKGIRVSLSIFINILLGPVYIFEACRLAFLIRKEKSDSVYNFYDPVGRLAAGLGLGKNTEYVVIGHHFYLSHPDFIHPHGMDQSYFWLQFMNRFMMRTANRVLALSFREAEKYKKIEVVPPLLDSRILAGRSSSSGRDLCYFLNPGFVSEVLAYYHRQPDIQADIFTEWTPDIDIPKNVIIHRPSREAFIDCMKACSRMICTSGFDAIAEAFYLGIPVFMIPTENHYEQYCNALDASRTGMAFQLDRLSDIEHVDFTPLRNIKFREWINSKEAQKNL